MTFAETIRPLSLLLFPPSQLLPRAPTFLSRYLQFPPHLLDQFLGSGLFSLQFVNSCQRVRPLLPLYPQRAFKLAAHLFCPFLIRLGVEKPALELSFRGRAEALELNYSLKEVCSGSREIADLACHFLLKWEVF